MAGTKAPRRKGLSRLATRKALDKHKQKMIPGTEPERITAIESAASKYVDFRDARMDAGEEEVKLKAKLIDAMKEHKLTEYSFDGYMVVLSHINEDEVKVKKARAAKEDGSLA